MGKKCHALITLSEKAPGLLKNVPMLLLLAAAPPRVADTSAVPRSLTRRRLKEDGGRVHKRPSRSASESKQRPNWSDAIRLSADAAVRRCSFSMLVPTPIPYHGKFSVPETDSGTERMLLKMNKQLRARGPP